MKLNYGPGHCDASDASPPHSWKEVPTIGEILGGVKHDNQKLRLDLLPFDALQAEAEVFTFGSTKYGDRNWERGFKWMRIVGATMRHLFSYCVGQDRDPETGKLHLAHAACCIHMLLAFQLRNVGEDDRVKLT